MDHLVQFRPGAFSALEPPILFGNAESRYILPVVLSGGHISAGHENAGQIDPKSPKDESGHLIVAGAQKHRPVKIMEPHQKLDHGCGEIPIR